MIYITMGLAILSIIEAEYFFMELFKQEFPNGVQFLILGLVAIVFATMNILESIKIIKNNKYGKD